jgi:hypothetical protein
VWLGNAVSVDCWIPDSPSALRNDGKKIRNGLG